MKTCFRAFCAAIVLISALCCAGKAEFEDLRRQVDELQQRVESLNSELNELSSLVQQIQIGNYVTAVIKDQEGNGYILAFSDGSSVHLALSDEDPEETPQIGVQQDSDGVWYWTLGGEWLLDTSGNRVRASSPAQPSPQIKMEGDDWFISYDGGATWEKISSKASSGSGGIFKSVDTSDPDCVLITLSDGSLLRLPTWAAFDSLRQEVKRLNINLASLSRIVSALQDYDYLVSTTPFVEDGVPVGWLLNFSRSGLVVIYSSTGGSSPQVGVRRDSDGVYYWTLGGEWLLDEQGGKVRAEGAKGADAVTPQFKIEDGSWWVTYDSGSSWVNLGRAIDEDGSGLFKDVDVSNDEYVLLDLSDGSSLMIPKFIPLDLILDLPRDLVIDAMEQVVIRYRIVGAQGKAASVSALVNGDLRVAVNKYDDSTGELVLSTGNSSCFATVVVILSSENGASVVRSFRLMPRQIYVGDSINRLFPDHYVATAPSEGGIVKITYQSNTSFKLDVSEVPWVTVNRSYTGEQGEIVLQVEPSEGEARSADIFFNYDDENWSGYRYRDEQFPPFSFTINQCSDALKMDRNGILAPDFPAVYTLELRSEVNGLRAESRNHQAWINTYVVKDSDGKYILYAGLSENNTDAKRRGTIDVKDTGGRLLGCVDILQMPYDVYYANMYSRMMELKVVAKPENDYTVCLPFTANMHLDVLWGDSFVSMVDQKGGLREYPIRHKYTSCDGPKEFTVKVFGKATVMTTTKQIEPYVTVVSVDRWGFFPELVDMTDAFKNCTTLTNIGEAWQYNMVRSFSGAFEGCTNLANFPVDFFFAAPMADNFYHTFYGVGSVKTESPYLLVEGRKVHLYERPDYKWFPPDGSYVYDPVKNYEQCFYGGHWADQEAIHLAGWD